MKLIVDIAAEKPNYEVGSSAKLSFAKPATNAWKLDDDEDNDLIDADDLLDEDDKAKPDPAELKGTIFYNEKNILILRDFFSVSYKISHFISLKVCGTTGKRKACKDCSCGLAEELDNEKKSNAPATENAKSSCGSVRKRFFNQISIKLREKQF